MILLTSVRVVISDKRYLVRWGGRLAERATGTRVVDFLRMACV
jgi:hypothetical protein